MRTCSSCHAAACPMHHSAASCIHLARARPLHYFQRICLASLCCRAPACWYRASSSRLLHLLGCWAVPAARCCHNGRAFLWCAAPAAAWAARLQGSLSIPVAVTAPAGAIVAAAGVLTFLFLTRAAPAVPLCLPVFRTRTIRPAQQHNTGMAPGAANEGLCAGSLLFPAWVPNSPGDNPGCSSPCLSQSSNPHSPQPDAPELRAHLSSPTNLRRASRSSRGPCVRSSSASSLNRSSLWSSPLAPGLRGACVSEWV